MRLIDPQTLTAVDAILRVCAVYAQNYGDLLTNYTPEQLVFSFKVQNSDSLLFDCIAHSFDQFLYVDVILVLLILSLVKVSVVQFYKRIFPNAAFARPANILLLLCSAWTFAGVVVGLQ